MRILGIETSCDETAAAVVERKNGKFFLLGSAVASSEEIHKKYGGIIPEKAAREQIKTIIPVIQETLSSSKLNIDAIAVTAGPGLIGSLIIGVETAKTLSFVLGKSIIPVNHLLAHLYVNLIKLPVTSRQLPVQFPAIGLIVSGGHTDLLLFKSIKNYKWLGGTRDDAAGECLDKCARLLGLGYPGGPEIEASASKFQITNDKLSVYARSVKDRQIEIKNSKLPRPMINEDNFDFSFSGLKTAVLKKLPATSYQQPDFVKRMAWEIQEAVTDVLVEKTVKAVEKYKVKSILTGGGVIANARLRRKLQVASYKLQVKLFLPEKKFCTDNALGIAIGGFLGKKISWENLRPEPGMEL